MSICAFIGHRNIEKTELLKSRLTEIITMLIVDKGVDTFLFGSRSAFNDISYDIVTQLINIYPHIKRVEVRSTHEYLPQQYIDVTLKYYEDTFFPEKAHNAGYLSYIKRNQAMIDKCDLLAVYCDMSYIPTTKTKSGTITAVQYAQKQQKPIINLFDLL